MYLKLSGNPTAIDNYYYQLPITNHQTPDMKKLILFCTALCMVTLLNAQSNAIDEFFDKYSEKEGFTTVTISSKLLSLFAGKKANSEGSDIINKLTSIRILYVEDSLLNQSVNFYKELTKKLDISSYEELMAVKEGSDVTKFLVKQKGMLFPNCLSLSEALATIP